jgi:hypothetical protein
MIETPVIHLTYNSVHRPLDAVDDVIHAPRTADYRDRIPQYALGGTGSSWPSKKLQHVTLHELCTCQLPKRKLAKFG